MRLQKTDKAKTELQPGIRTLGQRQRTLLLMADGHKTLAELGSLFGGDGTRIALQLLEDGFLTEEKTSSKSVERSRTQIRMSAATGSTLIQMDDRALHRTNQWV